MKDYYLILGIPSNATQNQIRSAYRRQVKELHPDYFGTDSDPFIELQKAYSVLKDPADRQAYDQMLQEKISQQVPIEVHHGDSPRKRPPIAPISEAERPVVAEVFLSRSFETYSPTVEEITNRLQRMMGHPKGERPESLTVVIPLSLHQARQGGHVRVMMPIHQTCPICRGRGGIGPFDCLNCLGQGAVDTEVPISVPHRAGMPSSHTVMVPLDRFGIKNLYLTVYFKISNER